MSGIKPLWQRSSDIVRQLGGTQRQIIDGKLVQSFDLD